MSTRKERAERMEAELRATLASLPPSPQTPSKGLNQGAATKALFGTLPQDLPDEGNYSINPHEILIQPWAARDESEYQNDAFAELKASIKEEGVNSQYIDVRRISKKGKYRFELLAGSRRLMACRELGINVAATIRVCDDKDADRIHERENQARKSKSVYSQGLRYSQLLQSGRYENQKDLATTLGVDPTDLGRSIRLVSDAPEGMWARISDPSSVTWREAKLLNDAYKSDAFVVAVKERERLTARQLVVLARSALRKRVEVKEEVAMVKVARGYVLRHPAIKDKALANKVLAAIKEILVEGK